MNERTMSSIGSPGEDCIDEQKIKNLLKNLKIIGSLNQHDKLCTSRGVLIDTGNTYQSVSRWISGENRKDNVDFIESVFEGAFEVSIDILNKIQSFNHIKLLQSEQVLGRLLVEIHTAQKGVKNLLITYNKDPVTVARLQILVDYINDQFCIVHTRQKISKKSSKE